MNKVPYREGSWFAVPLRGGGFAAGLLSRASPEGVILCYLFGPRRAGVPTLKELSGLKPNDAALVVRAGDLNLVNSEWPIIGSSETWERERWPIPPFVRRDPLSRKASRVYYSDLNPSIIVRETPEPYESNLERNGLYGAGALEIKLSQML